MNYRLLALCALVWCTPAFSMHSQTTPQPITIHIATDSSWFSWKGAALVTLVAGSGYLAYDWYKGGRLLRAMSNQLTGIAQQQDAMVERLERMEKQNMILLAMVKKIGNFSDAQVQELAQETQQASWYTKLTRSVASIFR